MRKSKLVTSSLCVLLLAGATALAGCKPKAVRGGPGTENPNLDEAAMSTGLDRKDIQYLVDENLKSMFASGWWGKDVAAAGDAPSVAIWPIMNSTDQHLTSEMDTLLGDIETTLVNSGYVTMINRERMGEMMAEVELEQNAAFDPNHAAQFGRQHGIKYFVTGKITNVDERMNGERRVQYSLFLQVIEVETSAIRFQYTSERSKAIVR